jgi:hypothetical protein
MRRRGQAEVHRRLRPSVAPFLAEMVANTTEADSAPPDHYPGHYVREVMQTQTQPGEEGDQGQATEERGKGGQMAPSRRVRQAMRTAWPEGKE